jgi:LPS-assembly protein
MLLNNLSINFARQGFQSLNPFITNGYVKKPEVNLEYKKYGPSFSYFAKANYADFDINKNQHLPVNIPEITKTGKRLITEIGIEALHDLKYFDLSINGLLVNKKYNLDYTKSNAKAISIPTIKIKISTFLRQSSKRNRALLIPELIYQKTNYKDQSMNPIFDLHQRNFGNLNRPNTRYFFGKDRVPDMEFLLARLKWQKKIDKDSRLYLQISKKNELESSKVINEMLNQPIEKDSQIGTNLSYENIRVRTYLAANYSQKRNKLNFGKSGVEIKLPEMRLSFSRNFQNNIPLLNNTNELDYAEFSIEKLMSNGYKFIGGISKDLDSKKNLETYVGFGYENCCVAFKLYASDKRLSKYNFLNVQAVQFNYTSWDKMIEIENKSRINFEFELKGLTGGNRRINSFFSNTFLNL